MNWQSTWDTEKACIQNYPEQEHDTVLCGSSHGPVIIMTVSAQAKHQCASCVNINHHLWFKKYSSKYFSILSLDLHR